MDGRAVSHFPWAEAPDKPTEPTGGCSQKELKQSENIASEGEEVQPLRWDDSLLGIQEVIQYLLLLARPSVRPTAVSPILPCPLYTRPIFLLCYS